MITRRPVVSFHPGVAFVQSDGIDAIAVVGYLSKPFLTLQAAYNAGATMFEFGAGSFGNLSLSGPVGVLSIRGRGSDQNTSHRTEIGTITTNGNAITALHDLGCHSVFIAAIDSNGVSGDVGAEGLPGEAGDNVPPLTLMQVFSGPITLNGGNGGNGGPSGVSGTNGGAAGYGGTLLAYGSRVGTITASGGNGGSSSGTGDGDGGAGGAAGAVYLYSGSVSGAIACANGAGGSESGSGTPGAPGTGGSAYIYHSEVISTIDAESVTALFATLASAPTAITYNKAAVVTAGTFEAS